MSPNSNGSKRPQLMAVWEVEYWANIPIETIEHFMSPGMDEWLQVYWTIVRCGPCHPHQSPVAMRPRLKKGGFQGWVKKLHERIAKKLPVRQGDLNDELIDCDNDGVPLCLTQRDLCVILGKTPNNVNRALVGGVEKGLVVLSTENNGERPERLFTGPQRGLRPIPKPTVVLPVAKNTKNFVIADVVLSTESLPIDPVLRTAAIGWLARLGTDWRKDLKGLRTDYRKRLREGCTEYGILIAGPRFQVPGRTRGQ